METKSSYQNRIEILQATLDILILKTLQWSEQHGYGISQAIRVTSGEVLQAETGSLYPALHRLERQGWVKAGRRAKAINARSSSRSRNLAKLSLHPTMNVGGRWLQQSKEL
jgi:PadR family transcriptional regulator PadR